MTDQVQLLAALLNTSGYRALACFGALSALTGGQVANWLGVEK